MDNLENRRRVFNEILAMEKAAAVIREFEGCALRTYEDAAGVKSIGYGQTGLGIRYGMEITCEEAEHMLLARLESDVTKLSILVTVDLTPNQAGALLSLAYNIGYGAFEKSTLLKMVNAGDFGGALHQFARWNKCNGKVLAGLTRRRAAEARIFAEID